MLAGPKGYKRFHKERDLQPLSFAFDGGQVMSTETAKFELGQLVATPGALEALKESRQQPVEFIRRHVSGDWSEMSEEDRKENEFSMDKALRIFSAYRLSDGTKIWIITEADRSVTTILLPSEY